MRFEEVYNGWQAGRLRQEEAVRGVERPALLQLVSACGWCAQLFVGETPIAEGRAGDQSAQARSAPQVA